MSAGAQRLEESSLIEAEGSAAGLTVKPSFDVAVDFDIAHRGLAIGGAGAVIAPLLLDVHSASSKMKDALCYDKNGLSRLRGTAPA